MNFYTRIISWHISFPSDPVTNFTKQKLEFRELKEIQSVFVFLYRLNIDWFGVFWSWVKLSGFFLSLVPCHIHSPSKCLVWFKKCCHFCLDQNFETTLLTSKLWLVFMGKTEKKNSKWPTQKNNVFQNCQFYIFFCENFMDWSLG